MHLFKKVTICNGASHRPSQTKLGQQAKQQTFRIRCSAQSKLSVDATLCITEFLNIINICHCSHVLHVPGSIRNHQTEGDADVGQTLASSTQHRCCSATLIDYKPDVDQVGWL